VGRGFIAALSKAFEPGRKFWIGAAIAAALTVPCAAVRTFAPERLATSIAQSEPFRVDDGLLCVENRCEPGVLVSGYLPLNFRERLDERIQRASGAHLWVCLLSAGGDSSNNLMEPLPTNVSTCAVRARLPDGSERASRCDSACAWVWVAGRDRELFGDAHLGFHRSWSIDSCWCEHINWTIATDAAWQEERRDQQRQAAGSPELARKRALRELAATKGRDEMARVDANEAMRRGLQTRQQRAAVFVVDPAGAPPASALSPS
jgi:hypothetical protein